MFSSSLSTPNIITPPSKGAIWYKFGYSFDSIKSGLFDFCGYQLENICRERNGAPLETIYFDWIYFDEKKHAENKMQEIITVLNNKKFSPTLCFRNCKFSISAADQSFLQMLQKFPVTFYYTGFEEHIAFGDKAFEGRYYAAAKQHYQIAQSFFNTAPVKLIDPINQEKLDYIQSQKKIIDDLNQLSLFSINHQGENKQTKVNDDYVLYHYWEQRTIFGKSLRQSIPDIYSNTHKFNP